MAEHELGVVAAGHPLSARAGAEVLLEGGNAVDAALGAVLASFVCEPLLNSLGAGGYMLVQSPGEASVLLDFFVSVPGVGAPPPQRAELIPVAISFGDAVQEFHIGVASVGCYGLPAGICEAARRFGSVPLADLAAPAVVLARDGVALSREQAYIVELLAPIVTSTPECAALFAPCGRVLGAGERIRQPELGDALERLGADGAEPFYTGDIGAAIAARVSERGGTLTAADLAAYEVTERVPVRAAYRGREVLTNPPPSAGGILIARALGMLEGVASPPSAAEIVAVMERVQRDRTPEFLAGLDDPAFMERFLSGQGGKLGSTTHVAAIDGEGLACSVTCSNGSSSGVVVPGTGVHLNNMLGEQDLNPLGFDRHAPRRRLPSMMAPTIVSSDGRPELVLGSAGSNRIRSAILQTIVRVIDEGLTAPEAVDAPRLHYEHDAVYLEPGIDPEQLHAAGHELSPFRSRNLFFGGVQAVQRDHAGRFWGGGDPRRGGAAIVVRGRSMQPKRP